MSTDIQQELEIIKESVLKAVPATAIYLFGSHAYGEPNSDSDLDIYVVVPKKEMCGTDIYCDIVGDFRKNSSAPIDLLLRDKDFFDHRISAPTLERKIIREGIKVYG
jgi:predicted nucleotidyltransferase